MKMRKILFFTTMFVIALGFISCKNDEIEEANVQITLNQTSFDNLSFAQPVHITGTAVSDQSISNLTFTGVKKENNEYVDLGEEQEYTNVGKSTISFDMEYFVDNNEITDIMVTAYVGSATKKAYIPVTAVTGEAQGSAFVGQVVLKADSIVWNAENHPETYTTPNTGAAATTPSFFSIHGVEINGEIKHVLTGDEVRSVEGLNGSFCFLNVLQNTSNKAYIGSQRGYMFSNLWPGQLGGGTTGRQCDLYEIGGKAIRQANVDTTQFKIIAGSWIGSGWDEARYKFVDSLFLIINNTSSTNAAKYKAYYLLGKIQEVLDNATLGETNNPTSLGALNYARRRTNAGTTGTSAMTENFRAGDYIILKNQKGGKLYYGIMQITQMQDDTPCLVDVEGVGQKLGQEETKQLFHKALILNVKVQTQL